MTWDAFRPFERFRGMDCGMSRHLGLRGTLTQDTHSEREGASAGMARIRLPLREVRVGRTASTMAHVRCRLPEIAWRPRSVTGELGS